jgi:DNA polymerase III subunit gamma/tau
VPQASRGSRGAGPQRPSEKPLIQHVLALKYRPTSFEEVVGQKNVTLTLRNALGRGKIGHAFLLSGARGVGKTTTARILAKALNCAKAPGPTPSPCATRNEEEKVAACDSCREIAEGRSLDVQEIDAASNTGVDSIRELREMTRYSPARDRFKIWIIDEIHMLSTGAFNALLKTLEEPPPRVKFVFATTEYHKIPETILSRCQQYDFRMVPARELQQHLRKVANDERIHVSDAALALIARAAEGSVRDSLSLFDQVLAFTGDEVPDADVAGLLGLVDRELLHRASNAIVEGNSLAMLALVESLADYGADYRNFVRELVLHLREILLVKLAPAESPLLHGILPEELDRLRALAGALSEEDLLRGIDVLTQAETELRNAPDPRVGLDLVLLKLVQLRRLLPFTELVARVERLAGDPKAFPAPLAKAASIPATAPPSRPAGRGPALFEAPAAAPPAPADPAPPAARRELLASAPPAPGPAETLLARMIELCQGRPSLAAPLRAAKARLEGDRFLVEVPPDFLAFGAMHADEYRDLARKAAGRNLPVEIVAGQTSLAEDPPPTPSSEEKRRQKLRGEVEKEPAVQEALAIFEGRVADVREAKASGEDP